MDQRCRRRFLGLLPVFRPDRRRSGSSSSRGRTRSAEWRQVGRMDRRRSRGRHLGAKSAGQQRLAGHGRRQSSDDRESGLTRHRRRWWRDWKTSRDDVRLEELERRRNCSLRA